MEVNGKPLLAYALKAARDSLLFSGIWVNPDDAEILQIGEHYGGTAYRRPVPLPFLSKSGCGVFIHQRHDPPVAPGVCQFLRGPGPGPEGASVQALHSLALWPSCIFWLFLSGASR